MPCQVLTQLQVGVDNATQLVKSSVEGNRIDVSTCTTMIQRLQTTLETVTAAELAEGSPFVTVAQQLISNLKVNLFCILYMCTHS